MDEQTQKAKLAKQLVRALSASHEELFQLILTTEVDVLAACLNNPKLNEDHLLALLKRKDLPTEIPEKIYRLKKLLNHRLILALIKNPATSDAVTRALTPQLHLFELVDICFLPGASADRRITAERNILQRLPTTPLGSKITLARRATAPVIAELLKEGHPSIMEACLNSPRLQEAAIYQFLNGPRATAETISMVARHNRWKHRANLQLAILKNSKTPDIWFNLWLPKLSLTLLKQMSAGQKLKSQQKRLVDTELKKRSGADKK